jgi:hypothetical protein
VDRKKSCVHSLTGYADFMVLGGIPSAKTFDISVGITVIMVVGNMCGWFYVEYFGRRNTALYGTLLLALSLLLISIISCIKTSNAMFAQVTFMAIWGKPESENDTF